MMAATHHTITNWASTHWPALYFGSLWAGATFTLRDLHRDVCSARAVAVAIAVASLVAFAVSELSLENKVRREQAISPDATVVPLTTCHQDES